MTIYAVSLPPTNFSVQVPTNLLYPSNFSLAILFYPAPSLFTRPSGPPPHHPSRPHPAPRDTSSQPPHDPPCPFGPTIPYQSIPPAPLVAVDPCRAQYLFLACRTTLHLLRRHLCTCVCCSLLFLHLTIISGQPTLVSLQHPASLLTALCFSTILFVFRHFGQSLPLFFLYTLSILTLRLASLLFATNMSVPRAWERRGAAWEGHEGMEQRKKGWVWDWSVKQSGVVWQGA